MAQSYPELLAEYEATREALRTEYLSLSKTFKTMGKFSDEWRLEAAHKGVEHSLKRIGELREKLETLRPRVVTEWKRPE